MVTGFMEDGGEELITGIIQGVNTAIIALAAFELANGVGKEHGKTEEDGGNLFAITRRTITRFVAWRASPWCSRP